MLPGIWHMRHSLNIEVRDFNSFLAIKTRGIERILDNRWTDSKVGPSLWYLHLAYSLFLIVNWMHDLLVTNQHSKGNKMYLFINMQYTP